MNFAQFLILQIIAHLLTDFIFQSDKNAINKNTLGFQSNYLKWHVLITFFVSWIFSFQFLFVFGAATIAITHYLIDGFKKEISNYPFISKYTFFIDQSLHILSIATIVFLYNHFFEIKPIFHLSFQTKYLFIVAMYLVCTKPTNIFIKEVFRVSETNLSDNSDLPNAGKLIGIIERWLVLTFVIINQFEAVGFLLAAKSILRYKEDNTIKTEYVLIGTMLSFGIAVILGIVIGKI